MNNIHTESQSVIRHSQKFDNVNSSPVGKFGSLPKFDIKLLEDTRSHTFIVIKISPMKPHQKKGRFAIFVNFTRLIKMQIEV